MIGITVEDYGIDSPRHARAARILEDLKNGVVSSLDSEEEVERRYGSGPAGSAWPDFRRASRAYATLHGCLVLVDDDRRRFVDSADISDVYSVEVSRFFRTAAMAYLRERREEEKGTTAPHVSARLSLHRLPRADYSAMAWEYFEQRGEYVYEQVVGIPTTDHATVRGPSMR